MIKIIMFIEVILYLIVFIIYLVNVYIKMPYKETVQGVKLRFLIRNPLSYFY